MASLLAPYVVIYALNLVGGAIASFGVGLTLHTLSLNPIVVFLIIIAADTTSDTLYYCIGRFASRALHARAVHLRGIPVARMKMVQTYYDTHGKSTVFLAKMSDVLAIPGIVIAGAVKMPFGLYLAICIPTSALKTILILAAGYFIGRSTDTTDGYFAVYGLGGVFLLLLIIIVGRSIVVNIKKTSQKR